MRREIPVRRGRAVAVVSSVVWMVAGCRGTPSPPREDVAAAPAGGAKLVLLGTGTPRADPDRMGPCAAVLAGGEAYLFDAGVGLVRRAAEAFAAGHEELEPKRLARVFLTHLHSDHTLGYPDLILTPWVLGRERALEAYGPPGLQEMTDHLLAAWAEDIDVRIHGAEGNPPEGVRVEVHEIPAGYVYRDGRVTITDRKSVV